MGNKIGILGSGIVAQTLAKGFEAKGFKVRSGSRQDFADIAAEADIVVLAVKGSAAKQALDLAGAQNLASKTIIDATNPIADEAPVNGVLRFFTGPNESLLEMLQKSFPKSNLVKAFSCVGNVHMVDPQFGSLKPTMFICGNSQSSKDTVTDILTKFGWSVEDCGMAEAARAIEPLCMLWCIPGFLKNQWNHAFALLKK